MKKTTYKKFTSPSRFLRKVLFHLKVSQEPRSSPQGHQMTEDSLLKEIETLKDQISNLKAAVSTLQSDTENKEVVLARLAREKEKLTMDLFKTRRSNTNLTRQLEDERKFYFKEKEMYCHEMNEFKKLKKALSNTNVMSQISIGEEMEKMKKKLGQTLQTNYNLSIKFLKMRETKRYLKNALDKAEAEHTQMVNDLKTKIENLSAELEEIVNKKFSEPISPSNKKFLQLVNQNSSLVYENLCLQQQVDQFHLKFRKLKLQQTKSETNNRTHVTNKKKKSEKRERKNEKFVDESEQKIIKLFERDEKPGVPTVTILNEKEVSKRKPVLTSTDKLRVCSTNESKLTVFQVSELQSRVSTDISLKERKRSRSAPKIVQSVCFKDQDLRLKRQTTSR